MYKQCINIVYTLFTYREDNMKKIRIIIACCIGIFLCMLDTTIMNIALPAIQSSLNVPLNQLSWPLNIYTILFASLTIPLGKLAEKVGINKFYCIGLSLFIVGSFVSGLSSSLNILVLGRGIQSIGAATVFPLSMTIGINTTSVKSRSKVIAALGVTQGLAAALGPVIGGVVTQYFGWKWIFFINVPMMILALLLCTTSFNFQEKRLESKIDVLGALISIISFSTLTLSLVQGREWGWRSTIILSLFGISFISFILFVLCEKKSKHPMIPLDLFKNKEFNGAALSIVLSNLFLVAVTVVLPTYFTKLQNKTELEAALLVTPISAMIFVFSPIAGILIDKMSPRKIIGGGFTLMTIAFIMFSTIDMNNYKIVVIACMLLGAGYGIIAGPNTVLAASNFTGKLLNASQSVAGVLREVGIVLAVAIYVTGLYNNVATAKTNSINHVYTEVNRLDIPNNKKKIVANKSIASIESEHTNSKTATKHFTDSEIHNLVEQNYEQVIKQKGNLPTPVKQHIYNTVNTKVNHKIQHINNEINETIVNIKQYAHKQFNKAFVKLYKYSVPFVALSILSYLLFDKKRIDSSKEYSEIEESDSIN